MRFFLSEILKYRYLKCILVTYTVWGMFPKEMKTMQKLICLSIKTEPNSGIETNLLNAERVEWGWIHQVTGEIKKTGCGLLGREAGQRSLWVWTLVIILNRKNYDCLWSFFLLLLGFKQSTLVVFVKEQFLKSPSAIWQRVTIFNHRCHQTDRLNNRWAV